MYVLFYLLIAKKKWRESLLEEYKKIIIEHLTRTDYAGIITHFCDCFLDELYTTLPHISTVHFIELLNPIIDIMKSKNNSLIYNSIKEHLLRSLVNDYETMRESHFLFFKLWLEGEVNSELPAFTNVDIRFIQYPFLKFPSTWFS